LALENKERSSAEKDKPAADTSKRNGWVEPITALIMALATVGTALCSYESAAWTGHSNRAMNQFNILERKAALLNIQGAQTTTIHASMFMQMLAAQQAGNNQLVDFYIQRFPPDVRKAYDAWIAQKPFENPNADPHPFVPNLYEMRGTREAAEATANAAKQVEDSRRAGLISRQYLANTVLFAAVLFFANAAGKFDSAAFAQCHFFLQSRFSRSRSRGSSSFRASHIDQNQCPAGVAEAFADGGRRYSVVANIR
jgi:hypothetical protein